MKNRKLPFGYELRMGRVCVKESEAEVVKQIYQSYREGASYNQIAGFLGSQPIPYREEGQPWNKNMVARILQDERYIGTDGFPQVIEAAIFQAVQNRRPQTGGSPEKARELRLLRGLVCCVRCGTPMARNQHDNWACPQCGGSSIKKTGPELLADFQRLLAPYTQHPEKIQAPPYRPREHRDLELRLEQAMTSVNEAEQPAYQAALALAAAQLADIGPERYENIRIRRLLEGKCQTDLTPTLIRQITAKILLGPTGAIAVQLKNGQVIGKEPQS